MSVIRHSWQILVCSECGEMDTDEAVCGFCESSEGVTLVEVVPADQLAGAVEALDEIAKLAKYLTEPAWTEEGVRLVGAQVYRLATRHHAGGQ